MLCFQTLFSACAARAFAHSEKRDSPRAKQCTRISVYTCFEPVWYPSPRKSKSLLSIAQHHADKDLHLNISAVPGRPQAKLNTFLAPQTLMNMIPTLDQLTCAWQAPCHSKHMLAMLKITTVKRSNEDSIYLCLEGHAATITFLTRYTNREFDI